ncbi:MULTISPECIES: hypothetical protein [unclassified Brenneria]|uniref:hypothetical protein n=1 Tax=unclassified Brenneria TaxID=2634434 RepID=UPI0029C15B1D|nr:MULTISPECIES: hypothetical protein [unclassified Brenneria]MDX5631119.1 hypothetical protein [Brenneria sp. L3-3Z]MDX5698192.1 hypothetical protein [Brenneria sp. L4-2C]
MLDLSYLSDNDGTKPSLMLNDKIVRKAGSSFLHLKNKTGVYVDPYGKTRIYPDHQKILIDSLADFKDKEIVAFIEYLNEAMKNDEVIIADGD